MLISNLSILNYHISQNEKYSSYLKRYHFEIHSTESKSPAIGSDHKTEKIAATATTAAALQQSFVDVDIQRGSGDGASAQPIEVVSEDIESSLFDDLQPKQAASPSSQTKTAPPSSKANLSTDVTAEDSTPPLMSVVSEIWSEIWRLSIIYIYLQFKSQHHVINNLYYKQIWEIVSLNLLWGNMLWFK